MSETAIIIFALVLTIISVISQCFLGYVFARETKEGLQTNHLLICLILFLMFNGFIPGVCVFFVMFKLSGVHKEIKQTPEKS